MADSLRRDHVGVYGNPPWSEISTPNMARFASGAAVFEEAYIGSFPTVPTRRDIQLGRGDIGLPFNRWKRLEPEETTFLQLIEAEGILSMLVTDTQNLVTGGINLQRDYYAWICHRGQEGDRYWTDENVPVDIPVPPHLIRYSERMWHQVLMNRAHRKVETDWFAPAVYTLAMQWLERNYRREDFFLWIDTFDPHEPWDPPQYYIDRYDPDYNGRVFDAPTAGLRKKMGITDRQLQHTRARYAAEVTMVDKWFGCLLDKLENLGILQESLVILTSDHGTNFDGPGEYGLIQKPPTIGADGMANSAGRRIKEPRQHFPLTRSVARIPLMIHVPGGKGERIRGIVQPWDLTATILDALGIECPPQLIGRSLIPMIEGKRQSAREAAVLGNNTLAQAMSGRWIYSSWNQDRGPVLCDVEQDPGCRKNVIDANPGTARELHDKIMAFMREQEIEEDIIRAYGTV